MLCGVVALAHQHRLRDHAVRTRRPGPSDAPAWRRSVSSRSQQGRRWRPARPGVSRPLTPRSAARTIISGMAASMQVSSTPSMTSMRRPVGNTWPVTAPQASRKFSRIGAARAGHAVDARVAVVGDAPAGRAHGDLDARAGVDVEHRRGGRALGGLRSGPARWRRAARPRACCRSWGACPPSAGRRRPGRTGSPGRSRVRPSARRSPPCCSACCRRRRRRAAAGRTRRSRRSAPGRARLSSAGSQSRRKNGPREVPARIRTQGRLRLMECNDRCRRSRL